MIYYRPEYFTFKILNIFKTDMQEKDFLIASHHSSSNYIRAELVLFRSLTIVRIGNELKICC